MAELGFTYYPAFLGMNSFLEFLNLQIFSCIPPNRSVRKGGLASWRIFLFLLQTWLAPYSSETLCFLSMNSVYVF